MKETGNGLFAGWMGKRKEKNKDNKSDSSSFPGDLYTPVLRCSICTGEQVAGFREKETGKFIDVMLIRSPKDLDAFREQYGVEELVKEY